MMPLTKAQLIFLFLKINNILYVVTNSPTLLLWGKQL
jgi:hypothetical protein